MAEQFARAERFTEHDGELISRARSPRTCRRNAVVLASSPGKNIFSRRFTVNAVTATVAKMNGNVSGQLDGRKNRKAFRSYIFSSSFDTTQILHIQRALIRCSRGRLEHAYIHSNLE